MNLLRISIGFAIEAVALAACGVALNLAGVREFPAWVSEEAVLGLALLYVIAHVIFMALAIAALPVPTPRLPNLSRTARRLAFPEPPAQRARRRTRRHQMGGGA